MDIPNKFYRVSVKALIQDGRGKIVLVQERSNDWSIPGGGLEFGESIEVALGRELTEELGVAMQSFTPTPVAAWPSQNKKKTCYCFIVLYAVTPTSFDFKTSEEVPAIKFFSPEEILVPGFPIDPADAVLLEYLGK